MTENKKFELANEKRFALQTAMDILRIEVPSVYSQTVITSEIVIEEATKILNWVTSEKV